MLHEVVVEDLSGNKYEYEVSEVFVVEPDAEWAIDPVRDRDMLTLQTCTYPDGENRIIVRVPPLRSSFRRTPGRVSDLLSVALVRLDVVEAHHRYAPSDRDSYRGVGP